jgi:hypothetical protein
VCTHFGPTRRLVARYVVIRVTAYNVTRILR